jgi:protein-S-isoprenylcysteine O-methyltransferase Ste14
MPTDDSASSTAHSRPTGIPWPPILLVLAIAGPWALDRVKPLWSAAIPDMAANRVGIGLFAIGVALLAWAILTMSRAGTTMMPHKGVSVMVAHGAYRFTRNPMYAAEVFMLLGAGLYFHNAWFLIAGLLFEWLVTELAIKPEERHLHAKFGDAFKGYAGRTRRWI